MKRNNQMNNFELILYFIFWVCSIGYSIYKVTLSANEYFFSSNFEDTYNDFSNGWTFLNRPKDVSDHEWQYSTSILFDSLPWFLIHLIVAEVLRQSNKQFLIYWYATISSLYIYTNFGINILFCYLFQPVLGYLVLHFKSKIIVWLYFSVCLIIITFYKSIYSEIHNLNHYLEYIGTATIFWINLRSLHYFLYSLNEPELRKISIKNIVTSISYCLYLPLLVIGPLILFSDFKTVFESSKNEGVFKRIVELFKKLTRYIFWLIFMEFSLHYVYTNALRYEPQIINNMNSWALYGLGYCMGQFFQMKYVVFYGLSTSLANFEGMPVPSTPKCIARIHLYSDMWKYFDRSLYLFLLRHIYIPISGTQKTVPKKLFASFMCFVFVYIWHGIHTFISIWSFLNFIGIVTETIGNEISQMNYVKNKITKHMSDTAYRRLKCILASPLFAMSAISNFYFFAGVEVGNIFMERFLKESMFVTMNVLIVLYFGSQVSMEIKLREERRKIKEV